MLYTLIHSIPFKTKHYILYIVINYFYYYLLFHSLFLYNPSLSIDARTSIKWFNIWLSKLSMNIDFMVVIFAVSAPSHHIVQPIIQTISKWFFFSFPIFFSFKINRQIAVTRSTVNDNVRRIDEIPQHCYFNQHFVGVSSLFLLGMFSRESNLFLMRIESCACHFTCHWCHRCVTRRKHKNNFVTIRRKAMKERKKSTRTTRNVNLNILINDIVFERISKACTFHRNR